MGKRVNFADLATDDLDYSEQPRPQSVATLSSSMRVVPIGTVALNPLNKRPHGEDNELAELAETIREHGVIQPLVVCSAVAYLTKFPTKREPVGNAQWVVLIGNRRLRAARAAGLGEVTIVVNDDQITSMYELMLVENGQRKELPALLEAEAMSEVLKDASISQRELARRIGKSAMYITQRLALLKLIPDLRTALERGELTIERARQFGELPVADQEAIVAAGKPYRHRAGNGVARRVPVRSIRVSSPAVAAESIRRTFNDEELVELIRLLSALPSPSFGEERA